MGRSFAWYQIRLSVKMNANTKVNVRRRYTSLLNYFGHLFNYVVSHLTLFSTVNFANSDVNTYFINVAVALPKPCTKPEFKFKTFSSSIRPVMVVTVWWHKCVTILRSFFVKSQD